MVRHLLSQLDLSAAEVRHIFRRTVELKPARYEPRLLGRTLVMFFEKSSTRTRLSFEIGMTQLGGHAIFMDRDSSQLSRGESIEDTARVISRYADLIMARVNDHRTVATLADHASIPVINGLSDREHPCQSMTDLFTIWTCLGRTEGVKIAYVGDGRNNVTHSLMLAATQLGASIAVASPPELQPDASFVEAARRNGEASGATVTLTDAPADAVRDAKVVYTDVWVSMGHDDERDHRLRLLSPYRVDGRLMDRAASNAIFMHCLPAHIGEEVTAEVAYGPRSVLFEQAENRLHVQKAIMLFLMESTS